MAVRVRLAMRRTRFALLLMASANILGLLIGAAAVHAGHGWTLGFRDRLVGKARASSPILQRYRQGRLVAAAALDCAGNVMAATATAAAGWWPPGSLAIAVYRGWIGGIVSVDGHHRSRFRADESGLYYVVVVSLQLLAYTLAGGAGLNVGLARRWRGQQYAGPRTFGIPHQAVQDAACVYALALPIFAVASGLEFLWRA